MEAFIVYTQCLNMITDESMPLVGADIYMRIGDCLYEGIGSQRDPLGALQFMRRQAQRSFLMNAKRLEPLRRAVLSRQRHITSMRRLSCILSGLFGPEEMPGSLIRFAAAMRIAWNLQRSISAGA